jgi:hypothetical protein
MRRPVSVSISNAAVSEPYVDYTLDSTVNYNVQSLTISYTWVVASGTGYKFGYSSKLDIRLSTHKNKFDYEKKIRKSSRFYLYYEMFLKKIEPNLSSNKKTTTSQKNEYFCPEIFNILKNELKNIVQTM